MFCFCTNTWHCEKVGIFDNAVSVRMAFTVILVFFIITVVDHIFIIIMHSTFVILYIYFFIQFSMNCTSVTILLMGGFGYTVN